MQSMACPTDKGMPAHTLRCLSNRPRHAWPTPVVPAVRQHMAHGAAQKANHDHLRKRAQPPKQQPAHKELPGPPSAMLVSFSYDEYSLKLQLTNVWPRCNASTAEQHRPPCLCPNDWQCLTTMTTRTRSQGASRTMSKIMKAGIGRLVIVRLHGPESCVPVHPWTASVWASPSCAKFDGTNRQLKLRKSNRPMNKSLNQNGSRMLCETQLCGHLAQVFKCSFETHNE